MPTFFKKDKINRILESGCIEAPEDGFLIYNDTELNNKTFPDFSVDTEPVYIYQKTDTTCILTRKAAVYCFYLVYVSYLHDLDVQRDIAEHVLEKINKSHDGFNTESMEKYTKEVLSSKDYCFSEFVKKTGPEYLYQKTEASLDFLTQEDLSDGLSFIFLDFNDVITDMGNKYASSFVCSSDPGTIEWKLNYEGDLFFEMRSDITDLIREGCDMGKLYDRAWELHVVIDKTVDNCSLYIPMKVSSLLSDLVAKEVRLSGYKSGSFCLTSSQYAQVASDIEAYVESHPDEESD